MNKGAGLYGKENIGKTHITIRDIDTDVEPEAHCYECPQSKNRGCAEFNALNRPNRPYDRGYCHWGAESIKRKKEAES